MTCSFVTNLLTVCALALVYDVAANSSGGEVPARRTEAAVELVEACNTATSGSCWMFNCYASRGPTDCVDHGCQCKPGYCAVAGVCHPVGAAEVFSLEANDDDLLPVSVESDNNLAKVPARTEAAVELEACNTQTGGSCWMFNCYASRGPTDCVSNGCQCQQGYCAVAGVCHAVGASVFSLGANDDLPVSEESDNLAKAGIACVGAIAASMVSALVAYKFFGHQGRSYSAREPLLESGCRY